MAKQNEDTIFAGYKYAWSPSSDISLKEYLAKFKPSMVENDGLKPWIWVRNGNEKAENKGSFASENAAVTEGAAILKDITDQVESIKNDPAIPTRLNKKTGAKSKKEIREELQARARDKFKEVARKHKYLCGKWLMFASPERVDMIWSSLATSLVEGPLSNTSAFCAKVATTPRNAIPGYQHVMCLYMPDVYDEAEVTKVMKILLRNHGFNLSGVKSDMYTSLGIDSKHPSGISSTIWKNRDLMKESEMQALKDAFMKERKRGGGATKTDSSISELLVTDASASVSTPSTSTSTTKPKPKPNPKKKKNDFVSDDDDDDDDKVVFVDKEEEEKRRRDELNQRRKLMAGAALKRARVSGGGGDDDDDEVVEVKPKRKIAKRL